jgi:site-specific recombinase XerD
MSDIIRDENEVSIISIRMGKTDDYVQIPLVEEAKEIVEKYSNSPDREILNFVLPRIKNQKINFHLKTIGNTVGIQKTITHHVARHTFATRALNRGIPIEVVQKLLGHTDLKTTQIYAKMLTSTVVKEMEKMGKVK